MGKIMRNGISYTGGASGSGGGSTGTSDYSELENKPSINGVELVGNNTADELGLASKEYIDKSDEKDGLIVEDAEGNIGVQIGSTDIWEEQPYNKKYGWGGHPYGSGELPPYSRVAGILESDMMSVRGGKGRWNKEDTGNFKEGGHVFEGWNRDESARLTMGIGLKHKDVAWIQTFHPAEEEGTDNGAYYGVTKVGSDNGGKGANFMPTVTQVQTPLVLWARPTEFTPKISAEDIEKLIETEETQNYMADKVNGTMWGMMYYDTTLDRVRVFTKNGWKTLSFE